jgi:uncharacterized protein YlxW (UPF0749 family)
MTTTMTTITTNTKKMMTNGSARWLSLALIAPASVVLFAGSTVWAASVNPLESAPTAQSQPASITVQDSLREQAAMQRQAQIDALTAELEAVQKKVKSYKAKTNSTSAAANKPIPRVTVGSSKPPSSNTKTGASGG